MKKIDWKRLSRLDARTLAHKPVTGGAGARQPSRTAVSHAMLYNALAAMAAVIEEPVCDLGLPQLRDLVRAHCQISHAVGGSAAIDYLWLNDCVVAKRNIAQVIKRPVKFRLGSVAAEFEGLHRARPFELAGHSVQEPVNLAGRGSQFKATGRGGKTH